MHQNDTETAASILLYVVNLPSEVYERLIPATMYIESDI